MSTVAVNLLTLDTTHLLFDVIVHEKLRVQHQLRAKEVGKYEIAKKKQIYRLKHVKQAT